MTCERTLRVVILLVRNVLSFSIERRIIMKRRKDNKGRVLQDGECQRKDGTYMFQYKNLSETENAFMQRH